MTKILICTPAFDGKVNIQYAIALAETCRLLSGHGIAFDFRITASGSLLCAERNRLTEMFMKSDCTHMLCIDSDIGWPAKAVIAMLEKDLDFIAGCYPSRREKSFLFRPVLQENGSIEINMEKQVLEMEYIPAGFMLIRKNVIQAMQDKFPELYFEPRHPDFDRENLNNITQKGYCFFNSELRNGEFWGEDYTFCRLVREAGFKIWVDPQIEFDHSGNRGCLMSALKVQSEEENKIESLKSMDS